MKEQLIEFETAKLAKEKGFNLYSQGWYGCDDPMEGKPNKFFIRNFATWEEFGEEDSQEGTEIYSAPTQSLLQKWLREEVNIHIEIQLGHDEDNRWFNVYLYNAELGYDYNPIESKVDDIDGQPTYEDALEIGLMEALRQI